MQQDITARLFTTGSSYLFANDTIESSLETSIDSMSENVNSAAEFYSMTFDDDNEVSVDDSQCVPDDTILMSRDSYYMNFSRDHLHLDRNSHKDNDDATSPLLDSCSVDFLSPSTIECLTREVEGASDDEGDELPTSAYEMSLTQKVQRRSNSIPLDTSSPSASRTSSSSSTAPSRRSHGSRGSSSSSLPRASSTMVEFDSDDLEDRCTSDSSIHNDSVFCSDYDSCELSADLASESSLFINDLTRHSSSDIISEPALCAPNNSLRDSFSSEEMLLRPIPIYESYTGTILSDTDSGLVPSSQEDLRYEPISAPAQHQPDSVFKVPQPCHAMKSSTRQKRRSITKTTHNLPTATSQNRRPRVPLPKQKSVLTYSSCRMQTSFIHIYEECGPPTTKAQPKQHNKKSLLSKFKKFTAALRRDKAGMVHLGTC